VSSVDALQNGYDAFISHSHADRSWARELAERISRVDFNGRPLRPWLDERFLDPGDLGQEAELTTALDRSRTLLLVLSPASVASKWVEFEWDYFLRTRRVEDVLVLLKAPCECPSAFAQTRLLDFTEVAGFDGAFGELVERLCPPSGPGVTEANASVDRAWSVALEADPGGLDAQPSPERDALLETLLRYKIDHPATEGLALAGFLRAAQLLLRDNEQDHPAAYNMKMCLGECLAVAVHQNTRYRQVAQQYLDLEQPDVEDPVLSFVVARAYSKLAEMDPLLMDFGTLLRVAAQLDAHPPFNNRKETVAGLLGRIGAKLRGTDLGDLLIQTLSEGGAAARIAAIGSISMAEQLAPSVYYLTELGTLRAAYGTRDGALEPPSRKLLALLFGIDLDQPEIVRRHLDIAQGDLRRGYSIDDLPYGYTWFALRRTPPAFHPHRAPFLGTVAKATKKNMEEIALRLNASNVVCFTEPRIVDALFDRVGGILISLQDENTPQCKRLIGREVSFAMLDEERMAELKDGDNIEIEGDRMRVVSA
jgi:TIR domain